MKPVSCAGPIILGIEGGGTRTVALAVGGAGPSRRATFGPANLRLLTDERLVARFREIARDFPRPESLGIGLAGARNEADRGRIRRAAARVWPGVPCHATHDLETALMAADGPGKGGRLAGRGRAHATPMARVLVLSGTGSCCLARTREGRTAKLGGWGHLLGDKGSGYEIGLRALKVPCTITTGMVRGRGSDSGCSGRSNSTNRTT